MLITVAWVVAYLLTGFFWVRRDQRRRGADRKAYVNSRASRWSTRLGWLPLSVIFAVAYAGDRDPSKRDLRELIFENALPAYALFAISGSLATFVLTR